MGDVELWLVQLSQRKLPLPQDKRGSEGDGNWIQPVESFPATHDAWSHDGESINRSQQ